MKVVVNATPLITLSLLGKLDILNQLFDEVVVPQSVYDEVVIAGVGKPGAEELAQAIWLHVSEYQAPPFSMTTSLLGLDQGEMDVLLLAQCIKPDWVIIDERQGRRVAHAMGLPIKGTLGILIAAVIAGVYPKEDALNGLQLMLKEGIRIGPRWQQWYQDEIDKA